MNADSSPISVDLAHEIDFSVGPLRVRPSLRQAESAAASETLEPRVMQVLVALARRAGEVVSRDDLVQACWAGRIVGDDAISRVIARVRRLGEAHSAFSLETIPRVGYRLMPLGEVVRAPATSTPATAAPAMSGTAAPAPASTAPPLHRRPAVWAAAGGVLAALALSAFALLRPPAAPSVDQVMARLSERLQQERSASDMAAAGSALRQLGASSRPEERSAFAALASNDGEHALDILEDLARQLESSGDRSAASQAWRRVGAIAPLFDDERAVAAQRRAFQLQPDSLAAFQSLFFITFLQDARDTEDFVNRVLADPGLSERMRGWALAHRANHEIGNLGEVDRGRSTLAEIRALRTFPADPVLQVSVTWIEALLAFVEGDLALARRLGDKALADWSVIPEKTSNSAEGVVFRVSQERGDWHGVFEQGSRTLDRRSREGDLLPGFAVWGTCEAGLLIGQERQALPYCRSAVQRNEGHPAMVRAYAAVVATLEGDPVRAAREFELAHGNIPPGGSIPAMVLILEAWAAQRSGDIAAAERILAQKPGGRTWEEATARRPAILAMKHRLHGQWLIAAGQPQRACAPLAEAERTYARYGGDAGQRAVEALLVAAGGCPS